jgi:hypothetical protein
MFAKSVLPDEPGAPRERAVSMRCFNDIGTTDKARRRGEVSVFGTGFLVRFLLFHAGRFPDEMRAPRRMRRCEEFQCVSHKEGVRRQLEFPADDN